MRKKQRHTLRPGDRVRVPFGHRIVEGTVTSVDGGRIHVALDIDGTDEPVAGLYRESELAPA
ncbi:hypothetical protein [Nocardia jiangxiensis]|uniref:Uncharacterized protein n=1 Tax=Nocardia jiangxiensis TaxID=282685 RepID=A0ABW6S5W4_9NOCA|nr:hypothetical protein [Nocardia jiangxiensis]